MNRNLSPLALAAFVAGMVTAGNDPEFRALIEMSRRRYPAGTGLTTVRRRLRSGRRSSR